MNDQTKQAGSTQAGSEQAGDLSLPDLITWLAEESLLFAPGESPFTAAAAVASPRLVLVVGENASGKSLFFRALCSKVQMAGVLPVSLSIRERTGAGSEGMSRFRQVMMFGDETDQSTGAASVRAVEAGFGNLDRETGSILALDEPELGLSDGYARALGEYIGQQTHAVPHSCSGVVVITHSRSLVDGLLEGFGERPTLVHLGSLTADLDAWRASRETRSVTDLLALPALNHTRFRATHQLLSRA